VRSFEVSRDDIDEALTNADEEFVSALLNAQENIVDFHSRQKQQSFINAKDNGVKMASVSRAGTRGNLCAGRTAAYPSSVQMNAIPAKMPGKGN
jgi:histidinol dehydrogenase